MVSLRLGFFKRGELVRCGRRSCQDGEREMGYVRFDLLDVVGDVYQGDDVHGELAQDRADDVGIEDIGLGAFFGQLLDGLDMKVRMS